MRRPSILALVVCLIILVISQQICGHTIVTHRLDGQLANIQPTVTEVAPHGEDVEDQLVFHEREDGAVALSITPKQACEACHATIDTGIILLRRSLASQHHGEDADDELQRQGLYYSASATYSPTGDLQWNSESMANEICEKALGPLKPHYTLTCHELISRFHQDLWKPFRVRDNYADLLSDQHALQYKTDFCFETQFCAVGNGLSEYSAPTIENTIKRRSTCESCLDLALDSRAILRRFISTIPNPDNDPVLALKCTMSADQFDGFTDTWCNSLSLRHFRPMALMELCSEMVNDHHDELYALLKDGNKLHRMLKDLSVWEDILCSKLTDSCSHDQKKQLYDKWDEASDYDFKLTETRYTIRQIYQRKLQMLRDLDEEFYFSDTHMLYDDAAELLHDRNDQYFDRPTGQDTIDLDDGLNDDSDDIDDEVREPLTASPSDTTGETDNDFDTDAIYDNLGRRLVGRLFQVNQTTGERIPNQLPPYLLREYKARRHAIIHDPHQARILDEENAKLQELLEQHHQYRNKFRVSPLPDVIHISERIRKLLGDTIARAQEKARGAIAQEYIEQTYRDRVNELNSATLDSLEDIHAVYNVDVDDNNLALDEYHFDNNIVENEDTDDTPPRPNKDEL